MNLYRIRIFNIFNDKIVINEIYCFDPYSAESTHITVSFI